MWHNSIDFIAANTQQAASSGIDGRFTFLQSMPVCFNEAEMASSRLAQEDFDLLLSLVSCPHKQLSLVTP